eukprot:3035669-Amphidinium_carterae.1
MHSHSRPFSREELCLQVAKPISVLRLSRNKSFLASRPDSAYEGEGSCMLSRSVKLGVKHSSLAGSV